MVTAALIRDHFAKQFRNAGGSGQQLTDLARRVLTKVAMEDRLRKCPEKTNFLVLFSGWPAALVGLNPVNAKIKASQTVSKERKWYAAVDKVTVLSKAKEGKQITYACQEQGVKASTVRIVGGSHPCDTFSNAGHINTERHCNYKFPPGAPRPGPKNKYATGHRKMARNMILSTKEWVAAGAMRGEQLYYYLEQGQSSILKKLKRRGQQGEAQESCFKGMPPPVTVDYMCCRYKVVLKEEVKHPTRISTSIWTNVTGWKPRRCPGKSKCHHRASKAGASEDRIKILDFTQEAADNWIPEGLHHDILSAVMRPR